MPTVLPASVLLTSSNARAISSAESGSCLLEPRPKSGPRRVFAWTAGGEGGGCEEDEGDAAHRPTIMARCKIGRALSAEP